MRHDRNKRCTLYKEHRKLANNITHVQCICLREQKRCACSTLRVASIEINANNAALHFARQQCCGPGIVARDLAGNVDLDLARNVVLDLRRQSLLWASSAIVALELVGNASCCSTHLSAASSLISRLHHSSSSAAGIGQRRSAPIPTPWQKRCPAAVFRDTVTMLALVLLANS